MKKNKDIISNYLGFLFLIVGCLIFSYPAISNFIAKKNQAEIIENYEENIKNYDEKTLEEELEKAKIYNNNLAGTPVKDPFVNGSGYALPSNYLDVLNLNSNGIMAYIEIPKINVKLPIYHGTDESVMQKGVGHIEYTSLPIGGNSTHSILTGHRGLPRAELFTRLDELNIGDKFYIHILNKILAYKVYDVKTVLPDDLSELNILKDKDIITLVTCTPYGVNTHRLLVQGERTEYINQKEENKGIQQKNIRYSITYYIIPIISGIIISFTIIGLYSKVKERYRNEKEK